MTSRNLKFALLTLLFLANSSLAKFAMPSEVPVERLIKNISAYVKEHPEVASGYYALGRVNYLALSMKSRTVRAYEKAADGLPTVSDFFQSPGNDKPSEAELKQHLSAAAENLAKAVEMEPKNALYRLGLASFMDAAIHSGLELGAVPGNKADKPASGKDAWRAAALAEYERAYDMAIDKDAQIKERPIHGLRALVSYEAAQRYGEMLKDDATEEQKKKLAAMQERLKPLGQLSGPITPIIFSLTDADRLDDLLDPANKVQFDLDGTGRGQMWPWVKPGTSILVWDPQSSGQITSGKQLFGTVTWWMFWENGYQALAALDNNHDGQLIGDELKGLAVWTDRNGNGVSDAGEVMSLESAGIEAIQTQALGRDGNSPMNALGLRMKDGRVLPTWDWVVEVGR